MEEDSVSVEMPKYRCFKEVHALKITGIDYREQEDFAELFFDPPYKSITVGYTWVAKHEPEIGGYYVVYNDGYTSFSPASAFEPGYTLVEGNGND